MYHNNSIYNTIRRLPKRTKNVIALLVGIAIWSAISFDTNNDNDYLDASHQQRSLRAETPFQRFLRELSENSGNMNYEDRSSSCPATDENDVENSRKATLVLMSYSPRRLEQVSWALHCYQQMTGTVDKILFVWNNLKVDLPEDILPSSNTPNVVPVQYFQPKENFMTNRFLAPSLSSDSSAPVILVDDDVFLTAGLISGMIDYWEDEECEEQCVVGLDPRYADPHTMKYQLHENVQAPNLVIGKTMMASNRFFKEYMTREVLVKHTSPPPVACEDIAFSLFVTNATGYLPVAVEGDHYTIKLKVNYQKKFLSVGGEYIGSRYDIPDYDGMSVGGGGWIQKRHRCVEWNLDYFGDSLMATLDAVHNHDEDNHFIMDSS